MFARFVLLALCIPFFACAGSPHDEDFSQPNKVVGTCPPCGANQHCVNGTCEDEPCGPANCATGCCSDNHCVSGTSASSCGHGGGLCDVCATDETCDSSAHSCQPSNSCNGASCNDGGADAPPPEPAAKIEIVLVSASVAPTKPDGSNWDTTNDTGCFTCFAGCCPPDVYTSNSSQFGTLTLPEIVSSNNASPTWNIVIGELDRSKLVGASVHIDLADEDPSVLKDDQIGSCSTIVTESDVTAGLLTLSPSRGCAAEIQSVVFALNET